LLLLRLAVTMFSVLEACGYDTIIIFV